MYAHFLRKFLSLIRYNLFISVIFSCVSISLNAFPSVLKIKAKDTPILQWEIKDIAVFCQQKSKWVPIAFQIDEINSAGDFVLDQGYPYTKFTDDGKLDDLDEILINLDSCDEFSSSNLSTEFFKDFEIKKFLKVTSFTSSTSSTFKNLSFVRTGSSKNSEISKNFYFDTTSKKMITPHYTYKFREDNPALLGDIWIKDLKTKSERPLLNNTRMIMPMQTPWFMPNHIFKEDSFQSEIESWKLGPIRTIVAIGVKYRSFLGLFNFHLFSELLFYKDRFEIPTRIEMPFAANKVLNYGSGVAYFFDFVDELEIKIQKTDIPSLETETIQNLKTKAAKQNYYLWVNSTPAQKSVLIKIQTSEKAASMSKSPFFITKDGQNNLKFLAAPKFSWLQNMKEDLGLFVDFSGLSKGDYAFQFELNIFEDSKPMDFMVPNMDLSMEWKFSESMP